MAKQDEFTRSWIIDNGIPIVEEYGGELTLRALHYRLVASGMTNSQRHYKRVVAAMTAARKDGLIGMDMFIDRERDVVGETEAEPTSLESTLHQAKGAIRTWMNYYYKNRWENQPEYVEVWIEKKALQSVFESPCNEWSVALCPCKGYPSLTYLYEASIRFAEAEARGQTPVILYFGDYDPSGEDIPRSIKDNLYNDMGVNVEIERRALMEEQVVEWSLPPAPTKSTDSRTAGWDGLGQVELDAVEPRKLKRMVATAIEEHFNEELYDELLDQEEDEKQEYRSEMLNYVNSL